MRWLFLSLLIPFTVFAADDASPIIVMDAKNKLVEAPLEPAYPNTPASRPVTSAPAETPAKPAPAAPAPADAIVSQFPAWAISKAGADTTGQHPEPAPGAPATPAAPSAVSAPQSPATAEVPSIPSSPTDKLWPKDTIAIFMKSCVGLTPTYAPACFCVITKLMTTMPHSEFITLSESGSIDHDKRMSDIRMGCLGSPNKRE